MLVCLGPLSDLVKVQLHNIGPIVSGHCWGGQSRKLVDCQQCHLSKLVQTALSCHLISRLVTNVTETRIAAILHNCPHFFVIMSNEHLWRHSVTIENIKSQAKCLKSTFNEQIICEYNAFKCVPLTGQLQRTIRFKWPSPHAATVLGSHFCLRLTWQ